MSRHCNRFDTAQPNILVDDSGQARITDFGLATIPQDPASKRAFHDDQSVRWTAPEILGNIGSHSKEADVFSFAMVVIEVRHGSTAYASNLSLSSFLPDTGFHWRDPIRYKYTIHGYDSHNAGTPPATAEPHNLLRRTVDINSTVLASGFSLAPGNVRSIPPLTQ